MKLNVKNGSFYKKCRLGNLSGFQKKHESDFLTPAYILITRKGSIPHLTQDVLHKNFSENLPICVPAQHFPSEFDILQKFGKGIAAFAALKNHPVCTIVQSPCEETPAGFNTQKDISVWTSSGRSKLDATSYSELINVLKPDYYEALHDADTPVDCPNKRLEKSRRNSMQFLDKCLEIHKEKQISAEIICPLIGGHNIKERSDWSKNVGVLNVNGYSLVGIHPNGPSAQLLDIKKISPLIQASVDHLPEDKPRFANGAYSPLMILHLVENGFDVFDSSLPTLSADKGFSLCGPLMNQDDEFVIPEVCLDAVGDCLLERNSICEGEENENMKRKGTSVSSEQDKRKPFSYEINLYNTRFKESQEPLLKNCTCYTCKNFTKGYLHHLLTVREMLAPILLTLHNLHHWDLFFASIRKSIEINKFEEFKNIFHKFVS